MIRAYVFQCLGGIGRSELMFSYVLGPSDAPEKVPGGSQEGAWELWEYFGREPGGAEEAMSESVRGPQNI